MIGIQLLFTVSRSQVSSWNSQIRTNIRDVSVSCSLSAHDFISWLMFQMKPFVIIFISDSELNSLCLSFCPFFCASVYEEWSVVCVSLTYCHRGVNTFGMYEVWWNVNMVEFPGVGPFYFVLISWQCSSRLYPKRCGRSVCLNLYMTCFCLPLLFIVYHPYCPLFANGQLACSYRMDISNTLL